MPGVTRTVSTLHVLLARTVNRAEQFLVRPHAPWGKLAPLVKKIRAGVPATLAVVAAEAFDGEPPPVSFQSPLAPYSVEVFSPTHRVPTRYDVQPWIVRYERGGKYDRALKALGGVWLSRTELQRAEGVTPTLPGLVRQIRSTPEGPLAPEAYEGGWTVRLSYAASTDQRAFGPLFEEMEPALRARLRGRARQGDLGDVLGETCAAALANLHRFQPLNDMAALNWLATLAQRLVYSDGRRNAVVSMTSLHAEDGDLPVIDPAPEPETRVEEGEFGDRRLEVVREVLAKLPEKQREAWRLRFEVPQPVPFAEIAARLGVKPATPATWVHRARERMVEAAKERRL